MMNVVITGAGMVNKGSQAMLFSTINGVLKKYPDANITCFSNREEDFAESVLKKYKFDILPWDTRTIKYFYYRLYLFPFSYMLLKAKLLPDKETIKKIKDTLKRADFILCPNGYNIGSRWSMNTAKTATNTIKIAKRFKKKIYLLPQSFGPFSWGKGNGKYLKELKNTLIYPEKLYCREKEGLMELNNIGITNAVLKPDLVICDNQFENISRMINGPIIRKEIKQEYKEGIIGIVINENVVRRGGPMVGNLYSDIIRFLIDKTNKRIMVIKTSTKDDDYLAKIQKEFDGNAQVIFDVYDYNSLEIMYYMKNFDFIIGSRYHSIIFAYYNYVPAVIVGWSEKYSNLAAYFNQERYVVSIEQWDKDRLYENIESMIDNYQMEKEAIARNMTAMKKENIFAEIIF